MILAIAGILFLTLYPFRFAFHAKEFSGNSPFLLQSGVKGTGALDDFLNVILFVPFGFGLAEKLHDRKKSRIVTVAATLVAGAFFSYGVEFVQFYIPYRDSGWHDVLTNTIGAVVGSILFEFLGRILLRLLSGAEGALSNLLTWRRAAWIIPCYFVIWFAASVHLQKQTQLTNWDPNSLLLVGNIASGRPATAWRGQIYRLEFWDRAMPENLAEKLTAGQSAEAASPGLIAAYDFSSAIPFRDGKGTLPDLTWNIGPSSIVSSNSVVLDGRSWLTSETPVPRLVKDFQSTKQFSLHVVCAPADIGGAGRPIVTISRGSGMANLDLGQDGPDLIFWFRNSISVRRPALAWVIPDVFLPNQVRDILLSFDGTNLSLFIDGRKDGHTYRLGPATALARVFRRVKTSELEGYNYVYYALVFFPGGILIGIAARQPKPNGVLGILLLAAGFVFPGVILEPILVQVSGRTVSIANMILAFCLTVGGSLWINATH